LAKSGKLIDQQCLGYSDRTAQLPLTDHAIFRLYSNTKLVTSVAAMLLVERDIIDLDTPLSQIISGLAELRVLIKNASAIDQTEELKTPITLRHLLSHTAGFSYGFVDPESLIDRHYLDHGLNLLRPFDGDLETFVNHVVKMPLAFQPGASWRYSLATDIVGYLIECVTGQQFDEFLYQNIFEPLDMTTTGFCVAAEKRHLVVSLAQANDMYHPMDTGYRESPFEVATPIIERPKFISGGGGLFSTVNDYLHFMQMLEAQGKWHGEQVIRSQTLRLMLTDQLPIGVSLNFPMWRLPGVGYGLGFALKEAQLGASGRRASYFWGGMAGTHSWVFDNGVIALCMTQMMPSFLHPFSDDFEKLVAQLNL
tara:strand:- start:863 stop:1960 length:1098 start_codon:yes stop_codon:yes gene_type:complete